MNDNWPTRQTLKSPYGHGSKAAAFEPHLKPSVSPVIIQQIANQMGKISEVSTSINSKCQQMLSRMPEIPEMDQPKLSDNGVYLEEPSSDIPTHNMELEKLFKSGYKPLDKLNGKWTETSSGDKKLLLE